VCMPMHRVTVRPGTPVSEIYAVSGERVLGDSRKCCLSAREREREREREGGENREGWMLFVLVAADGRTVDDSRPFSGTLARGRLIKFFPIKRQEREREREREGGGRKEGNAPVPTRAR